MLSNARRRVVHRNVTAAPNATWTGQQIIEAFQWDTSPRYLLRDRDGIHGPEFVCRIRGIGLEEVVIAPSSPWQNPYVERVIGSIRRECLDQVIVLNEKQPRRLLRSCLPYYHGSRTHLGLRKGCPEPRLVEPPDRGSIRSEPMVGGLHHLYLRRAA